MQRKKCSARGTDENDFFGIDAQCFVILFCRDDQVFRILNRIGRSALVQRADAGFRGDADAIEKSIRSWVVLVDDESDKKYAREVLLDPSLCNKMLLSP